MLSRRAGLELCGCRFGSSLRDKGGRVCVSRGSAIVENPRVREVCWTGGFKERDSFGFGMERKRVVV